MATPAGFRTTFPEFGDTAKYTDPSVTMWLGFASQLVNAERWGDLADLGMYLITAHNLVLGALATQAAALGGVPGRTQGIQTNKSVDKVSVGYDASSSTEEGAGHWNQTSYGARFYRMSMLMGAGPVHVGADTGASNVPFPGAWPGVL